MHALIALWFNWVAQWGYPGVVLLMAMESSIFPVPSEVVIPPAAFWAAQGGDVALGAAVPAGPAMTYWGVILAGTVGSYLGSMITYWVSRSLGRAVILRWGRFFFISPEKLERAEHWMQRYEAGGIFFARLLPVIRHLISIPAGVVRMNFATFSATTIVGSFIWCWVLAWLGRLAYRTQPDLIRDPQAMIHFCKAQSHWIILGIAVLAALYFLVLRLTAKKGEA